MEVLPRFFNKFLTDDLSTMYSISDSGLTVLPVGSLNGLHRVKAMQEDVLFSISGCDQGGSRKYIDIADPSGGHTDFTLTSGSLGITFSQSSGTTPAHVAVDVDVSFFQSQKGTTVVPVQISSTQAVNLPFPVRVLVNVRDPDQTGTIYDVPGTIVDGLQDPNRNQFYVIRQDRNQVLVYDSTTFTQKAILKTGNTPVQMAITKGGKYLLITNDNSQFVSVFDLDTLQASSPILFPAGYYGRSIAVSNSAILATSRVAPPATPQYLGVPARVHKLDLSTHLASPPAELGIYQNCTDLPCSDSSALAALAASPTGGTVLMTMADGTVALYEAASDNCSPPWKGCGFVTSRHDLDALSGAYAALSDSLYAADVHVLNTALVPVGQIDNQGTFSSGVSALSGFGTPQSQGVLVSATPGFHTGLIERFDLSQLTASQPIRIVEAPIVASGFTTPPVGQIGKTILPFTRSLALKPSAPFMVMLSTSGFTVLPVNEDKTAAGPPPAVSAVISAADGSPGVAPGGLISIYGSGLASSVKSANSAPLPHTLAATCVSVNNESIPLLYASPSQINAQLPFDLSGEGSLVVRTSGGVGSPFSFNIEPNAPAIFLSGTAGPLTGLATVLRGTTTFSLVTLTNPIHPKDILVIYLTGMGLTSPLPETGDAAPTSPLAYVVNPPTLTLGNAPLQVLYAGLAPGEVGVYQINATVPWWVSEGMQLPLTISQGGQATTVSVRVVKP